jgi:uncharacterized SAM-dependent methyltransferase
MSTPQVTDKLEIMMYLKNTELAKSFQVSLGTVRNWIEAAQSGKLDITLMEVEGKTYVANTAHNMSIIDRLVQEHRKYRNTKAAKLIAPLPEFYSTYTDEQIYDIATNLEIHREIPRQYNYFDDGAIRWDKYTEVLASGETPNIVNSTIKLLEINQGYLDNLLAAYNQVNVIDVGVGNAHTVKKFLGHLIDHGKLGRYIALDISPDMLNIARRNLKAWFGDRVAFEGYESDINYERFSGLLVGEYTKADSRQTINVALLLGGTLSNMRVPDRGFSVLHDSMGVNDLLIYANKLDTKSTRRFFDFHESPQEKRLPPIHSLVVDMLGIDKSYYDVETGYNPEHRQRYEQIRLKIALNIRLEFKDGERLISFNKGDTVLVWRGLQQTAQDVASQFDRNDLNLLQSSLTEDQEYILTVSRIKRDQL